MGSRCSVPFARPIVLALTCVPASSAAQVEFAELGKRHLPVASDSSNDGIAADVDGDGDSDWVVFNAVFPQGGDNRLYLNDGSGTFVDGTAGRLPASPKAAAEAVASDIDGDGDLDLVLAAPGQNRLYRNTGNGAFVDATVGGLPLVQTLSYGVALGDVEGDGDPDIVFANSDDTFFGGYPISNRLLLNGGNGTFTNAPAGRLPPDDQYTNAVVLVDVDNDFDLDLVAANSVESQAGFLSDGQDRLYRNNGSGTFVDITAGFFPADQDGGRALAAADVDGDGRRDLVIGNIDRFGNGERDNLYRNVGGGHFEDASTARLPQDPPPDITADLEFADVTGDGAPDLFIGNYDGNRLYVNNGTGKYFDGSFRLPDDLRQTSGVDAADLDADGDFDLLAANSGESDQVLFNDGEGFFVDGTSQHLPNVLSSFLVRGMDLGDADGDGDLDVAMAKINQQNLLFLNQGNGVFEDATERLPEDSDFSPDVVFGDVDGDLDLDLVFGTNLGNSLYLNDGAASFSDASAQLPPSAMGEAVLLEDVDGDADRDLILGTSGQDQLLRNDGDGFFTDATAGSMPALTSQTTSLAFGDVDGDGDGDLALGNLGQSHLFRNDGTGTFADVTTSQLPALLENTNAILLGDVDADGDLDLLLGNEPLAPGTGQNRLWKNDGDGAFTDVTATHMPQLIGHTEALALADLELDGDPDLVATGGQAQGFLYINDGTGVYGLASPPATLNLFADCCEADDLDGDGDPDLLLPNRLFANLLYQLDAPLLARTGQPFRMDVYSRGGDAPASWALLRLDPSGAPHFAHAPGPLSSAELPDGPLAGAPFILLPIPQPFGMASATVAIPNEPSLAGTTLVVRARFLNPASGLKRFSNVTRDVVLR